MYEQFTVQRGRVRGGSHHRLSLFSTTVIVPSVYEGKSSSRDTQNGLPGLLSLINSLEVKRR